MTTNSLSKIIQLETEKKDLLTTVEKLKRTVSTLENEIKIMKKGKDPPIYYKDYTDDNYF